MRCVLTVTGTRSDWGAMTPVYAAIAATPGLRQECVLTGMHLLSRFAESRREVERNFPGPIHVAPVCDEDDTNAGMAKALGRGVVHMAEALSHVRPDILLLQGDRGEMLAAAIAGAHMNVPVVHLSGGDRSGTIDDSIRHAVSTLAHVHLTTCEASSRVLLGRGEAPGRILAVGEPGLDVIRAMDYLDRETICAELGLDPAKPLIVVAQHPVTTESDQAGPQMRATLDAVLRLARTRDMQAVVTAANSDAGGEAINAVIAAQAGDPRLRVRATLGARRFLSLLRAAVVLVGNSSSGIWEAPSFGLPAVNVGTRQHGRLRATNVLDVPHHDAEEILAALETAVLDPVFRDKAAQAVNPYGDGHAGDRTARVLGGLDLDDPRLVAKWLDAGRDFLAFAR